LSGGVQSNIGISSVVALDWRWRPSSWRKLGKWASTAV